MEVTLLFHKVFLLGVTVPEVLVALRCLSVCVCVCLGVTVAGVLKRVCVVVPGVFKEGCLVCWY